MSDIKTELIEAKVAGSLTKVAGEKLAKLTNGYSDFCYCMDKIASEMGDFSSHLSELKKLQENIKGLLRENPLSQELLRMKRKIDDAISSGQFIDGSKLDDILQEAPTSFKDRINKGVKSILSSSATDTWKKHKGKALALSLLAAGGVHKLHQLQTKKQQKEILNNLKANEEYKDKTKVENVYNMMSMFAPRITSNPTFAKSMMDQFYHSPIITAPMVKDVMEIEQKIQGEKSRTKDIIDAMKHVPGIAMGAS